MVKCEICGKECNTQKGLTYHIQLHLITPKEYYDKYLKKENEGICPITNKITNFINISKGYYKFKGRGINSKDLDNKRLIINNSKPRIKKNEIITKKLNSLKNIRICLIDILRKISIDPTCKYQCQLCGIKFERINQLIIHVLKKHKIAIKEYYDKFFKKENDGICKVCNKEVNFNSFEKGYFSYCYLTCSNKDIAVKNKYKNTCLEKYGFENPNQHEEIKNKSKETCIKRYGKENPMQNEEIKNKSKKTCIKRYGKENPSQVEIFKLKRIETNLERYGYEYAMSNPEIMQRCIDTWNFNYIEGHPSRNLIVKDRKIDTCIKRYGKENPSQVEIFKLKRIETNLERYGYEYAMSNPIIYNRFIDGSLKKYGVKHPMQCPDIVKKISGKNSYRWIENKDKIINPYPPIFRSKDLRDLIRFEQNNIDPIDGVILESSAHLHHIDYNKLNNERENLIFLNQKNHMKTNHNREYWRIFLYVINDIIVSSFFKADV